MVSNRLTRLARSQSLPIYVWSVYDSDRMLQYLQMGGDRPYHRFS